MTRQHHVLPALASDRSLNPFTANPCTHQMPLRLPEVLSYLNPKPQTPNPKPQTPNPKPSAHPISQAKAPEAPEAA